MQCSKSPVEKEPKGRRERWLDGGLWTSQHYFSFSKKVKQTQTWHDFTGTQVSISIPVSQLNSFRRPILNLPPGLEGVCCDKACKCAQCGSCTGLEMTSKPKLGTAPAKNWTDRACQRWPARENKKLQWILETSWNIQNIQTAHTVWTLEISSIYIYIYSSQKPRSRSKDPALVFHN